MFKKLSIITIMILVLSVVSNAYVNNYEVSRNIADMQRLVDFGGVWSNQTELNRLADDSLHILREPVGAYDYRYANWEKTYSSDSRMTVMTVEHGSNRYQTINNRFENVYSIQIDVPKKWGLFHGNDPIFVRSMYISYKDINGQIKNHNYPLNRWFNKGDDQTFELNIIAVSLDVTIEAACQIGEKKDCALYVNAKKAELKDSYSNPNYSSVENLKRFKKEMTTLSKDQALTLLADIDRELGGNSYSPVYGNDTELIEKLRDVAWDLPSNTYEASSKLRRIIRVLTDENYDRTVIREIEDIEYIVSRNQYGDARNAEERINRLIDRLESGSYNSNPVNDYNSADVKSVLSRIENMLPYDVANALRYARKLRSDVNDTKITRVLDRVINLLETNNSADARQAKDLVNRLINTLNETGNGSYTPAPVYYNLRGELTSLKSYLPYNASMALRKVREIKSKVNSNNYSDTIKRGIDRIALLIEKGDYSSCDQAKKMIDRVISQL